MASHLSKEDLCVLQCALVEAIGLCVDSHRATSDIMEQRAMDATIILYRKTLAKVRVMDSLRIMDSWQEEKE